MEEVKTAEQKHPDFPQWIKSKSGQECADLSTVKEQKYLENRLFWAFDAGRNCVWDQYLSMKEENKRLREALEYAGNYLRKGGFGRVDALKKIDDTLTQLSTTNEK